MATSWVGSGTSKKGDRKMTEQQLLKNITDKKLYNDAVSDIADARFYYEGLQKITAEFKKTHNICLMDILKNEGV